MNTDQYNRRAMTDRNTGELERSRLLDAVGPRLEPGMVLTVTCGPGMGKTIFLRQLQRLKGERAVIVDLAGFSADSSVFVRRLERIMHQLWPALEIQREQGKQGESHFPGALARFESLLDELLLHGDTPALLIFDGCEVLVDRPQWMELVNLLLSRLPSFLSLVLSSRLSLDLSALPILRLQGRLLELGSEDLYFDAQEVRSFFSAGIDSISDRDAALVHEKIGGWPAGIALLRMEMKKRGTSILDRSSTACLHEYMQCAVFAGLTTKVRRMLCSLALVQPFNDRLLAGLFGEDQDLFTDAISAYSFFFAPQAGKEECLFAHLYADFFRGQAPVVLGRDGVADLHRRAATLFLERGDNDRALVHLIAIQEWDRAVECILTAHLRWFEAGDYNLLPHWADQLPAQVMQGHPGLNILLGQAHLYLGNIDAAARALAWAHAKARPGTKGWLEAGCLLCEVMLLQGNKEEEVELAAELADRARLISKYRVRAMMYQAIGLNLLCRFRESTELWQRITTLARSRIIPLNRTARSYIMAPKAVFHNLEKGEFEESNRILDEAIAMFRVHDPMKRLGWSLLFKGICKLETHQYAEALVWMREAEAVSSRTNRSVHAAAIAFLTLTLCILEQHDEAGQWLERAEPLASRDLSMWAPIICALSRAYLGRDSAAALQFAWNLAEQRLMLLPLTMTAFAAFSLHGRLAGSDCVEHYCRQAAEKSRQWMVAHREARLLLYLSVLQQGRNPEQEAHDFRRAMELISGNKHGFLLTDDSNLNGLALTIRAIEDDICTEYFLGLAPFWGRRAFEALTGIFSQARLELKTRIIELWVSNGYRPALGLIEQTVKQVRGRKTRDRLTRLQKELRMCPPDPLHVRLLGRFAVLRDEEEIPMTAWKRHKARDLFKYLCLHPKTVFTREQLTELFWPEVSPDKGKAHLWSAISTIRTALEPELPARAPSSYLSCTSQTYALDLPPGSTIDTVAFSDRIREGRRFLKNGDTARALLCFENALSLYQGELLPEDRYAHWSDEPRDHYQQHLTDTLRSMADIYKEKRDFEAAIRMYRQILSQDTWDEDSYLELMRCYVLQGRELKAVELYQQCEQTLERELGITPAPELREFVQRILVRRQSVLQRAAERLPDQPT